jgi:hypothetical protein
VLLDEDDVLLVEVEEVVLVEELVELVVTLVVVVKAWRRNQRVSRHGSELHVSAPASGKGLLIAAQGAGAQVASRPVVGPRGVEQAVAASSPIMKVSLPAMNMMKYVVLGRRVGHPLIAIILSEFGVAVMAEDAHSGVPVGWPPDAL